MKVQLVTVTPNAEETIVEIARVSSSRKNKKEDYHKLLNYLIDNKHWSPFEHGYMTIEIETSIAIGRQFLRHRSFTFQEFSQRYQDVSKHKNMFQNIELRKQADDNRQSSTEEFNPKIEQVEGTMTGLRYTYPKASEAIKETLENLKTLYKHLIEEGVARECARMILPMCTTTHLYMTGNIRSWIHFLQLRDDGHAQKEAQDIAKAIKEIFVDQFPVISNALKWLS